MKTLRIVPLTLLALALLLAAGAPPSGALDAGGGQAREPVAPAQPSALTIGTLLPLTGVLAPFGQAMENGAELAVTHINDSGGVLGQPVVWVSADTATDPNTAVNAAQDLIDTHDVDAIVGAVSSGATIAVAEQVAIPNQVLLISPASTSPAITDLADDDLVFRTTCSDALQGAALAQVAWDQGYTTACTLYLDDAYGQGISSSFTQAFEALGGTVQAQVPHADKAPGASYLTELTECTAGSPDVLAAMGYPQHGQDYLDQALDNALIDQFVFSDGLKYQSMFDDLDDEHPGAFEGMYGTAPGSSFTSEFATAYEDEYGDSPGLFVAETYDAVVAIAVAAEAAGSTDSVAIRDALRGVVCPPGSLIGAGATAVDQGLQLAAAGEHLDYEGGTDHEEFNEYGDGARGVMDIWKIESGVIVTDREEPAAGQPDADGDGFDVCREVYLGVDFLDNCPDDPSDDAWPLDINVDTWSNVLDVLLYKGHLQTQVGDPAYDQRLDLNADAWVNVLDVLLYKGHLQVQCTNP
jgi:branched-chain amino acid transport system substrate-binding protein